MADIMMCQNENCKLKENCYRYTAKPSAYSQCYMLMDKEVENVIDCEYFWDNEK